MKNLHKLDRIPDDLRESIFEKLFEREEIAKFSREEYQSYEYSVKYYRDLKNSIDYAKEEGKIEDAVKMLEKGLEVALIAEITELTEQEIKKNTDITNSES